MTDRGKRVVLGLVTSRFPELEPAEELKARIDEAAGFVPLDQLCLSPQCGFSSTIHGNIMSEEQQWAKLRHVVAVAADVRRQDRVLRESSAILSHTYCE